MPQRPTPAQLRRWRLIYKLWADQHVSKAAIAKQLGITPQRVAELIRKHERRVKR